MLKYLHIENLAVVTSLELELESGFTVITGETGAGKSILLRSIGLLLGDKADQDMVRTGAEKALVEGEFDISGCPRIKQQLDDKGFLGDDENQLLVRRQLGKRQRVWINGTTATLGDLCEITGGLIEVSGQHEHQLLTKIEHHIELLDRYANLEAAVDTYNRHYRQLHQLLNRRKQLDNDLERREQLLEDISYSIEEITAAKLQPGELENLEEERRRLTNVVRLRTLVASAEQAVYSGEVAAEDRLGLACNALKQAGQLDSQLLPMAETVSGLAAQLSDVARDLSHYMNRLEDNPQRLEEIEERLELIRHLQRKYGSTVENILAKLASLQQKQHELENSSESFAELEAAIAEESQRTIKEAKILSVARHQAAAELVPALLKELADLGMPKARMDVRFTPYAVGELPGECCNLGAHGLEQAELLFSSNPGQELKPLARIASGGELSRVMLSFKVVLAGRDAVSSYLFDEVDTGVGGALGQAIGRKIRNIAADKQAITITHLPQLAACADHHLFLSKISDDFTTSSGVKILTSEERVSEIARMLDGEKVTDTGREHARTLLTSLGG